MRGNGIGKMLLGKVIDIAKESNAKQLHWQVLDWNTPAIDFYKKIGCDIDAEWLDCKMSEKQLKEFQSTISNP
jgi:ribosomal protein S18 acetylase RimI-like enzyme